MGIEENLGCNCDYQSNHLDEIFRITSDYTVWDLTPSQLGLKSFKGLDENPTKKQIKDWSKFHSHIESILLDILEDKGINDMIFWEALKNCYLFGNDSNVNKKVFLYMREDTDSIDLVLEDEGDIYSPEFLSFISNAEIRERCIGNEDFHKVSDSESESTKKWGYGLMLLYNYFSRVEFYKSESGGTILKLKFEKEKDKL